MPRQIQCFIPALVRLKQAWHDMAATPRQIQCLMLAIIKTPQTWHDAALKCPVDPMSYACTHKTQSLIELIKNSRKVVAWISMLS